MKRAVENALNFLKPIGVLLDKLQDDTTKLADTFDLWKAVLEDVPVEYSLLIAKRVEMALTSVVYAVNLLDHRYNGKTLSPLETATAVEYLKEKFGEAILPELAKYMGQVAPYSSYLFLDSYKAVNPCAWWRSGKNLVLTKS